MNRILLLLLLSLALALPSQALDLQGLYVQALTEKTHSGFRQQTRIHRGCT